MSEQPPPHTDEDYWPPDEELADEEHEWLVEKGLIPDTGETDS